MQDTVPFELIRVYLFFNRVSLIVVLLKGPMVGSR